MVGAMFENASLFLVYNQLQAVIRKSTGRDLTLGQKAMAAAGGGAVASFFLSVQYFLSASLCILSL